jgi:hypothetical protein
MADDVSEQEQVGDGPEATTPDRRREIVIGVAAGLLLLLGAWIWLRGSDEDQTQACTVAGAVGTPSADSPEAAFAAWFEESGETASLSRVDRSGVDPPALEDYEQTGDTTWEWYYQDNASVRVDVAPDGPDSDAWAVAGVNGCTYS